MHETNRTNKSPQRRKQMSTTCRKETLRAKDGLNGFEIRMGPVLVCHSLFCWQLVDTGASRNPRGGKTGH